MKVLASVLMTTCTMLLCQRAAAQWTTCSHEETWWGEDLTICAHKQMLPRSTFTTSVQTFLDQAWRGWWELDTSNHAVWLDFASQAICSHDSWGGINCFSRNNWEASGSGEAAYFYASSCTDEVDIWINTANANTMTTCSSGILTEEGTLVHEAGHGYGYAHFDDWLSTMNTFQPDVTSCQSRSNGVGGTRKRIRPSSQAQWCHKSTYGLPARKDVGSTPLRKICGLGTGGCAAPMATNHIIGASSTSTVGYLEYTRMSMRNSWTGAGVEIDVYLSSDANLSAGDARVYSTTLAASSFAAGQTSTTSHIFSFNPQVAMPAEGTTYCFIVQMDRSNVHSEFAEDDNVMDTQVCYTRM